MGLLYLTHQRISVCNTPAALAEYKYKPPHKEWWGYIPHDHCKIGQSDSGISVLSQLDPVHNPNIISKKKEKTPMCTI
jgi:hypothetical protein